MFSDDVSFHNVCTPCVIVVHNYAHSDVMRLHENNEYLKIVCIFWHKKRRVCFLA